MSLIIRKNDIVIIIKYNNSKIDGSVGMTHFGFSLARCRNQEKITKIKRILNGFKPEMPAIERGMSGLSRTAIRGNDRDNPVNQLRRLTPIEKTM